MSKYCLVRNENIAKVMLDERAEKDVCLALL